MQQVLLKTNKFGSSPWLFRKMVVRPPAGVKDGDIVEILDPEKRLIGCGFYNSKSEIVLRVLHRGGRRDMGLSFFREKIREAIYLRHNVLGLNRRTDTYRVINSEGDGFPGLIVDRYGKVIVLSFFSVGYYRIAEGLRQILSEEFDGAETVLLVNERVERREGFQATHKNTVAKTVVTENGIRFHVDFQTGHKTGFFCDQRENRAELAKYCKDKNVLDGCCYTGGFSLYAKLQGGAGKVVGVDLDEEAIAVAKENAKENKAQIEFVHADVFNFLRQEQAKKSHWDVVVLDPPKLATSRTGLIQAEKTYKDLNYNGMSVLKNGGLLVTCSCSGMVSEEMFLAMIRKSAARADRNLQILKIASAGPDHPEMPNFPESKYLKVVYASVRKN